MSFLYSAGVGRTGTFIALDIMLQRLKTENKINVFETVKRLRSQRTMMVQNCDQYIYLYLSVLTIVNRAHRTDSDFVDIKFSGIF